MATATTATGHGASISFGTSSLSFQWRRIGRVSQTRGKIEDSDLSNTNLKSYLPEDLAEPGEVEIEFVFDPTAALASINAAAETITITGPIPVGGSTAPDLEGTGFIAEITASPEYASNGLQVGTMRVVFDGKTAPAWTAAT